MIGLPSYEKNGCLFAMWTRRRIGLFIQRISLRLLDLFPIVLFCFSLPLMQKNRAQRNTNIFGPFILCGFAYLVHEWQLRRQLRRHLFSSFLPIQFHNYTLLLLSNSISLYLCTLYRAQVRRVFSFSTHFLVYWKAERFPRWVNIDRFTVILVTPEKMDRILLDFLHPFFLPYSSISCQFVQWWMYANVWCVYVSGGRDEIERKICFH